MLFRSVLQDSPLAVGGTVNFGINGATGMIANGCPSMVQVLWDNGGRVAAAKVQSSGAQQVLQSARARQTAATSGSVQQAMETLNAQW